MDRIQAGQGACSQGARGVFAHECQNCGTTRGGVWFKFPGGGGCTLWACPACKADVRAYARTERRAARSYARRTRGRARLAAFREQAKDSRALARFITMHAACAVLGGAL